MRKIQIGLLILILGLALVLQGCGGPSGGTNPQPTATPPPSSTPTPTPIPAPSNVVHVSADITAETNWSNDNLYVIDDAVFINAALIIPEGTIIKFDLDGYLWVNGTGSITADGTEIAPIYFTSIRDDHIGGNTDGSATPPAKGDWTNIVVRGANSSFDYCQFYYGGGGSSDEDAEVEVATVGTSFTNCTFAHSLYSGLKLKDAEATCVRRLG
jgi:hypothetical protein